MLFRSNELFNEQVDIVNRIAKTDTAANDDSRPTVAFFYITSNGQVQVRKSTDYVPKMISLAGGKYIFDASNDDDTGRSTMNMQLEDFYNGAIDADYLIYNSAIDGGVKNLNELLDKCPVLADFRAVKDFSIKFEMTELKPDGTPDYDKIASDIAEKKPKMVYIQRSRGYSTRPTLTWREIKKLCEISKANSPESIIMLDNCYGEFIDKVEPLSVGVDMMAGSLIKNPGGGIAPTGGYIAGKKELVEMCAYRLTTPGTGKEIGATLNANRELFMGAYHAPHVTGEALKTAVFASALFEILGYETSPKYNDARGDIIQLIMLGNAEKVCRFCEGVQSGSAVDSFVSPIPSDMPGYESQVVMAAGAFTLGSSIELSADAPLREPYAVWMQGSLNFHSGKLGVMLAASKILRDEK